MITELSREALIEAGLRHRAEYLMEQAGYTLGLAALDGKPLLDLLPDGYLEETKEVMAKINQARQDKALMAEDAKETTRDFQTAFKQAKVWRRKVARRAGSAAQMGKSIPDGLMKIDRARTGPALAAQVSEMGKKT